MKKVLITGAKGQLGLELYKQLSKYEKEVQVIAASRADLDIIDFNQVKNRLVAIKPDIVINCAAYTAVDQCEKEHEKAYRVNALGPKHLAIMCNEIGAKLVHISTDYVFDGEVDFPRREDDRVAPQSIYGCSKLLGEEHVKNFSKKYFIIRTAWLYGEGKNFVNTMLQLARSQEVLEVVGDQYGSPTSAKDLAKVIIELMQTEYYGIYHGTCEGQCSWYDFACKIFELKGIKVKVNKVSSEAFIRPAKRPKYSVLDNFMLKLYGMNSFRNWEEALRDYLKDKNKYIDERLN